MLTSQFSLSHARKCHALDLPDVGFDLGGGDAQETKETNKQTTTTKKQKKNKQAKNNQTKTKQ